MSETPENRSFPHVIIRASAGTGKTFQLSNRYLALLNAGVSPDRILATTFTRKAAAEILDRIVMRLAEAVFDEGAREELSSFLGSQPLDRDRCETLLAELLRNLHRLHVSTLDSFFAQMARSMSLEIGLPLAWRIVDALQDATLRDEAIEAVIHNEKTSDLVTLTHLLTKGEASRTVGQLIRGTVNDLETLYQETDAEAWQKVPRYKPLDEGEWLLLLEELRTLELPDKRFERARDADYQRALLGDWEKFITTGIAAKVSAGEEVFYQKPIPAEAVSVYSKLLQHARALLVSRVAMQTEGSHDLLKQFDGEYQQLKQHRRATRFADITRSLGHPLRGATPPAAKELYRHLTFRLDTHIQHLLLDEFQDTAPVQWEVLQPFAERITQDRDSGSFFCVGDTKQAIYGWRGGVAEIFDAITAELTDLETQGLNTSFRSSQTVIDTVNRVFQSLERHPNLGRSAAAITRWQTRFEEHSTARSDLRGYACLLTAPSADQLLDFAAARIAALANKANGTVGVLVRRNETVGKLISLLRDLDVRASEEGGNPLTDSAAVQLVLSITRLADHPGDSSARFHVATSPVGPALGLPDHTDSAAAWSVSQTQRQSLIERGYGPTISDWAALVAPHSPPRDRMRLSQLVELAFMYQPNATGRSDDFVRFVENERVADPTTARIRVMTIHQAKGLEFDTVVLPELDGRLAGQPDSFVVHRETPTAAVDRVCRYVNTDIQKLLPKVFQDMFQDTTDRVVTESLCVLYVALTRAVHALHMIIAPAASNERLLPRTYAGLLRAALRDDEPATANSVLYEHGDPNWSASLPVTGNEKTEQAVLLPSQLRLAAPAANRRRGLERRSPSSLEGGSRVALASVFDTRQSAAMHRGSIIHAWFELIEWLDDGEPTDGKLRSNTQDLLLGAPRELSVAEVLSDFREMLKNATIAHTLSKQAYDDLAELGFDSALAAGIARPLRLVVENERTFAVRHGGQLLNGSIDRIVWLYAGKRLVAADVIDFKTDRVGSEQELAQKAAFYAPQLDAYRSAVCRMSGLAKSHVLTRLLFVGDGKLAVV